MIGCFRVAFLMQLALKCILFPYYRYLIYIGPLQVFNITATSWSCSLLAHRPHL